MPFTDEKYNAPSRQGAVGGIALDMVVALDAMTNAIQALARSENVDIRDELIKINKARMSLWKTFVELTGYEPEP